MAPPLEDAAQVHAETRAQWRSWLAQHHASARGAWLVTWRKPTGRPRVDYADGVEEALCYGWVDSVARTLDDERSALWFAPRKRRSGWARSNKQRVERLLADGLMRPAGLAVIERAKADGSWTLLDEVEDLVVPADLAAALAAAGDRARASFDGFPRSARRGILEWIVQARRPETRERRVGETARLAARGERANQWRKA